MTYRGGTPQRPRTPEPQADLSKPSGWRWRLTGRFTARSRGERFRTFTDVVRPGPDDRILDIGVIDTTWRASNFLELHYPWPHRITAVALEDVPNFRAAFPEVSVVIADGRALPFEDRSFDVAFSNAVLEHVGSRSQQRQFVHELVRTARVVFISTPNARFPVDPHTLWPFIHWLPRTLRHPLLRVTGNGRWANEAVLNPLTARDLLALFPHGVRVRLLRQRFLGLTTVLTVVAEAAIEPGGSTT